MKAVMTGATGFIGSHLREHLLELGWEVEVIGRGATFESLSSQFARFKPDVVFHLASLFIAEHKSNEIADLIASNITFGTELVEAMKTSGIYRLINTSTSWQNFEDRPGTPVCLYAATKSAFEEILRFYSDAEALKVISLEIFDTYGPNDKRPKLVPKLLQAFGAGAVIDLSPGDQMMDFVHIQDVVQAFAQAGDLICADQHENGSMKKYSVSSGELVSLKQLVGILEKIKNDRLNIRWGARPYRRREVMAPWSKGTKAPGWSVTKTLESGLRELING